MRNHFALTLAFGAVAGQVTITLFDNTQTDCVSGGATMTCNNFLQGTNQCCDDGIVLSGAVLFNGLETSGVPQQGIAYTDSNGNSCGTSCNSGYGQALCLTCSSGVDGANYITPMNKRSVAEESKGPCKKIKPDQITFGNGQSFDIYYDVPQHVTDRLLQLRQEDPYLVSTELTQELRDYERM